MPISYDRPLPRGGGPREPLRPTTPEAPQPPTPPAPGPVDLTPTDPGIDPLLDGDMDPSPLTPLPMPSDSDASYVPMSSDLPLSLQGSKGGSFARVGTPAAMPFRQQLGGAPPMMGGGAGSPVAPSIMLGPNTLDPLADPDEILQRLGR